MDYATSLGLAFSSGVNAYLPLLSFSIAARWFHLYKVNPNFSYVTQDWFIAALAILTLADIFADKIPVVDHIWDAIHTVLRPIAGAIVVAVSQSHTSGTGLVGPMLAGGVLAGMVHTTKAVTRLGSTATTGGCANVVLSILEDFGVVATTLLSLFAPTIMIGVIILFVIIFLFSLRYIISVLRRRRKRAGRPNAASSPGGAYHP